MSETSATRPICVQCGLQYPEPRADCPVCEEQRQFVNWDGQRWTTLEEMRSGDYRPRVAEEGPGIVGIGTRPSFAIGQRALLVRAPTGNVLWDCVTYLDDELVGRVHELGGITAIAISHPHYYGTMTEWAREFDVPVYLHASDRQWAPITDDHLVFWEGDTHELDHGLTLINAGVHFAGGSVLHWRAGEDGRGALLSGDIVQVVPDRRWVSFMYSYPNLIPERPSVVRRAVSLLDPFPFERVYGAWWGMIVDSDGAEAVRRSARRYLDFAEER